MTAATPFTRRRSCLSVSAASEKMLAKALALPADEIVLDLEDSVPPAGKAEARDRVAILLTDAAWQRRTVAVRVNAVDSPWFEADVRAAASAAHPALTLVVPKVESADDLSAVDRLLVLTEADGRRIGLQALIETARGLADVQAIARSSDQLVSLVLGYADLAASLGRPPGPPETWRTAQDTIVLAARANGLQPIDGPHFALGAGSGLEAAADHARQCGFDGKWAIHPAQVDVLDTAFTPTGEEVEQAKALLAELERAESAGAGASAFAGAMIDEAMRASALRTLVRAGVAP